MTTILNITSATTAEADAYHSGRGNSAWVGDATVKDQALTRSWDYIVSLRWKVGVFDGVFADLATTAAKNAQIVGALRELVTPGTLQPDLSQADYLESKTLPGIKKTFKSSAPAGIQFTEIKSILRPYVRGGTGVEMNRG